MRNALTLTLAAAAALGAGAVLASEATVVEPTAPSFVRELGAAGTATVGGTVIEARRDGHFVLADVEDGRITVDAGHLRLGDLQPGQMITITGSLDGDELDADQVIREDGSVVVRELNSDDGEDDRD